MFINLFIFRYVKDEVIPFDEYQCCIVIKHNKGFEEYIMNNFKFEMTIELDKVQKEFDDIKSFIESNNLGNVLDYLAEKINEI